MRLKKLELYGFKSFALRTEIVFNEGITGIVGPNGSGKSNIGDAVRWVLGEQSAKTLRGANMADVIFGGTQKRKPLSYCEVSLVFDNEDHALPVDFAEVMITRRVYRNGESEYYLNRASCRLKDVIDLFRDTGIGKEGYSIIGQGRIDEILSRRGEDRRQIFEEAAGIVKFKARKEEADKKLERTLDNAARVDDILEELSRQLAPLERQAQAARTYIAYSDELKVLDMNLFLIRSDQTKSKLAELDAELMNLRAVLAEAEQTLADKTTQRDARQQTIAQLEEKITGARNGLLNCQESVHQAQNKLAALTSRREARQENRARIQAECRETEEHLAALMGQAEHAKDEEGAQEALVRQAEDVLEKAKAEAQTAAEDEQAKDRALEEHKAAVLSAMNRLSAVQNDQTRLKTMQGQMSQRLDEITASETSLAAEEARLDSTLIAASARVAEEEANQARHAEDYRARQVEQTAAEAVCEALRTRIEQQNAAHQAAQSRQKLLTDMTREMDGYNQSVKRAVQWAASRGMQGVRGVLAQLISVPRAYETAIDMALGAAQQNIVTDTEETAKTLIDYLRQNRFGRATFLPMSAVRSKLLGDRERQVLSMPGCIGVASELVSCDPAYRGIIENLLGRTVIAKDLDTGIPIMRAGGHSFRLVTLEGDVMHSGGSMTGGSAQSRMVNLLSRERELKELTARLAQDATVAAQLRDELTKAQQHRQEAKTASEAALAALHQQEIAVAREHERQGSASAELTAHRARMAETAQAEVQLREAIAQLEAQLGAAFEESGTAQLDRDAMEARTRALQDALAEARRLSAEATDRVMTRTLQLSDLRHELDSLTRDRARFHQDSEQLRRDQARRQSQLAEMDTQDAQDAREAAGAEDEVALRQAEQKRQEQTAQALESRRLGEQEQLRQLLTDMEGLHEGYTRDSDRVHRTELNRARLDSDLRALQDRIWNTYELTYAGAEEFRQESGFDASTAQQRATELSGLIRALGSVNVNAMDEYAQTKARYDDLTTQQADLKQAETDLRELIERLLEQMKTTFVANFTLLQGYFSETFTRLFGGGHAELSLMNPADPLNCGIEVNAQPPGKKLQLLSLLSGGERALTAIAILFAMLKLKPTPFCILDEIEAALDDANIGYFADYLSEYSSGTQFVVVTHRKGTMERCDTLYGVAMEEQGVSRMVSVSLQDYKD